MPKVGLSSYTDQLRDELWANHPQIEIMDFSFCNLEVFNHCEHDNALMMAVPQWVGVHPLLKIVYVMFPPAGKAEQTAAVTLVVSWDSLGFRRGTSHRVGPIVPLTLPVLGVSKNFQTGLDK